MESKFLALVFYSTILKNIKIKTVKKIIKIIIKMYRENKNYSEITKELITDKIMSV